MRYCTLHFVCSSFEGYSMSGHRGQVIPLLESFRSWQARAVEISLRMGQMSELRSFGDAYQFLIRHSILQRGVSVQLAPGGRICEIYCRPTLRFMSAEEPGVMVGVGSVHRQKQFGVMLLHQGPPTIDIEAMCAPVSMKIQQDHV